MIAIPGGMPASCDKCSFLNSHNTCIVSNGIRPDFYQRPKECPLREVGVLMAMKVYPNEIPEDRAEEYAKEGIAIRMAEAMLKRGAIVFTRERDSVYETEDLHYDMVYINRTNGNTRIRGTAMVVMPRKEKEE